MTPLKEPPLDLSARQGVSTIACLEVRVHGANGGEGVTGAGGFLRRAWPLDDGRWKTRQPGGWCTCRPSAKLSKA